MIDDGVEYLDDGRPAALFRRDLTAERAQQEAIFEASKVRFILQTHGLKRSEPAMLQEASRRYSRPSLAFEIFNEMFYTYPVLLGASRLDGISVHSHPDCLLGNLFKTFDSAPFVAALQAFEERVGDSLNGRAVGLVFPRKGYRNGWVIHTDLSGVWFPGTVLSHLEGNRSKYRWLHVRSFQSLVLGIWDRGHGWRP